MCLPRVLRQRDIHHGGYEKRCLLYNFIETGDLDIVEWHERNNLRSWDEEMFGLINFIIVMTYMNSSACRSYNSTG